MKHRADFPSLSERIPDGIKPGGHPYKVMIVEDKEFQRKQMAQILESEEYEIVATAANGQEALEIIEKIGNQLDLITTNLDMPVLDGYAMMHQLQGKNIKPIIVFVSEDTTKGVMQDLISMGIVDYILKPINRRLFLERIKRALSREK